MEKLLVINRVQYKVLHWFQVRRAVRYQFVFITITIHVLLLRSFIRKENTSFITNFILINSSSTSFKRLWSMHMIYAYLLCFNGLKFSNCIYFFRFHVLITFVPENSKDVELSNTWCSFYFWIAGHLISMRCILLLDLYRCKLVQLLMLQISNKITINIFCLGEKIIYVVNIHGTINSSLVE